MIVILLLAFVAAPVWGAAPADDSTGVARARELKDFIRKEKPQFERRENQRHDILDTLDRLNADQNQVRRRIASISANQQELTMALDNLSMEQQKQKELETGQKKRLYLLLRIVYRIQKEGVLRFIVSGENLSDLASRVRILYRTLRSHSTLTRQFEARANRLAASERKITDANEDLQNLLEELHEQEGILASYLQKKQKMLRQLTQKQNSYQLAQKEFHQISSQLGSLFDNFESLRDSQNAAFPARASLPLPVESGRIVKNFGRSIHQQFHTVTYQKGVEIAADYNTQVTAILPGLVEYDGWVKGLGNVIIVHHGGGFYSLCAHLYKTLKPQGTRVAQGEAIGLVGDTGNSAKPSLYFEIRENGKAVDPIVYFSPKALRSLQ